MVHRVVINNNNFLQRLLLLNDVFFLHCFCRFYQGAGSGDDCWVSWIEAKKGTRGDNNGGSWTKND